MLGNLKADLDYQNWFGGIGLRYVGKQYTDNSQNEDTAIDAYYLVNADAGYRFKNLPGGIPLVELRLRANNLLDREYESVGYADTYIVGAPRSFYATVAIEL
jgi:outer membrane receptor protein involved in Fe transport